MSGDLVFLVEMGLVFGLILAWAVWELVKLNRDEKKDADAKARETPKQSDKSE